MIRGITIVAVGSVGLIWKALWSGEMGERLRDVPINCVSHALSIMNVSCKDAGACDRLVCIAAGLISCVNR